MKNQAYQATNMKEFKEELARGIYGARSVINELEKILEDNKHSILDDADYKTEYIKLLEALKLTVSIADEKNATGSCTLVARELNMPNYLKEWFEENVNGGSENGE